MHVAEQDVGPKHAIYNADAIEVMQSLPEASVHFSIYSPPFCGLYVYSSDPRDLSNCDSYEAFFKHYDFVVREKTRITLPGRMTAVHCADVLSDNSGAGYLIDFPGDIIRLHERYGWKRIARYDVWKEPFAVRMRTMAKGLVHQTLVEDSSRCTNAAADFLLVFRKAGANKVPIKHPIGLSEYAGERPIPEELLAYKGWSGKQTENRLSHWIWRQYASAFWDDIRSGNVLPFKQSKTEEDEKHVHPLQLDIIDRALVLWTNPGETVFTPFLGVGSEVYAALRAGRRAIGSELKPTYFRQAKQNIRAIQEVAMHNIDELGQYSLSFQGAES
jgi:DNA modification methylase